MPLPTDTLDLLQLFRQSFADSTLSAQEARDLRARLADHQLRGAELEELRRQLFEAARERFNCLQDKTAVSWLEAASALLLAPAVPQAAHSAVYFSSQDDCVGAIQGFIGRAARQLDVCVFTISDDRLTAPLLAAHRRGVRVRLLTDNDKLHDLGSDITQLHAAGLPTHIDRTDHHMHHKFAVADERTLLTGSYNWTRSAAEYNQENFLITDDPALVQRYAQEFGRLWSSTARFDG